MASEKMIYQIPSFDAGMMSAVPMTSLPQETEGGEGFTKVLKNIILGKIPGQVKKRDGTKKVLEPTDAPIKAGYEFIRTDTQDKYLIIVAGDKLLYWDDGWEEITDGLEGDVFDFLTIANKVAIVSDKDDPMLWDGESLETPSDFPKSKYLDVFRLRVIAAGDPDDPLKLSVSHPGDPTDWDETEAGSSAFFVYISPDDGQRITGVLALDDFVMIGKERNIYGMFGTTTEDFAIFPVDSTVGVGSHRALKNISETAYFPNRKGEIFRLRSGSRAERISDPISDLIDEKVDTDNIDKTTAFVVDDYIYVISLPTKDSRLTLCFDTRQEKWFLWDLEVGTSFEVWDSKGEIYFSKPEGEELIRLTKGSTTDEGESIDMLVQTPEIHFGLPGVEKEVRTLFLRFRKPEVTASFDLFYRVNSEEWSNPINQILPEGEGYWTVRVPIGKQNVREFEIKIQNDTEEDITLLDANIVYFAKEVE